MVTIFVIESFESFPKRPERKRLWEELQQSFQGKVEIALCPQERYGDFLCNADRSGFDLTPYDVVFIHDRDKQYGATVNYVDLAKKMNKPLVCYSGGITGVNPSTLKRLQIEQISVEAVQERIRQFLNQTAKDGNVAYEAFCQLAGVDPRLEDVMTLLYTFLPLDIELQLGDLKEIRRNLKDSEAQIEEIPALVKAIMGLHVTFDDATLAIKEVNPDKLVEVGSNDLKYLNGLLAHMAGIKRVLESGDQEFAGREEEAIKEKLDSIFGFVVVDGKKMLGPELETGYHRTYEKLRDALLSNLG